MAVGTRIRKLSWTLPFMAAMLAVLACGADNAKTVSHKYVGVKKCKTCHKRASKGNQYGKWAKAKHANAYKDLASDKAKEMGKKAGVEDPQKSPKCLKCHTTGYGVDAKFFESSFNKEDGVQCESCHGPGKDYRKLKVMKHKEMALQKGLVIPDENVCKKCHNKESPAFKGFCYAHFLAKIIHLNPKLHHEDRVIKCTCDKKEDLHISADGSTKLVKQK